MPSVPALDLSLTDETREEIVSHLREMIAILKQMDQLDRAYVDQLRREHRERKATVEVPAEPMATLVFGDR